MSGLAGILARGLLITATVAALGVFIADLPRVVADQEAIAADARTWELPEGRLSAFVRMSGTVDRARERGCGRERVAYAPLVVEGQVTRVFVALPGEASKGSWAGTISQGGECVGRDNLRLDPMPPRPVWSAIVLVLGYLIALGLQLWPIARGDPGVLSRPADALRLAWETRLILVVLWVVILGFLGVAVASRWWRVPVPATTTELGLAIPALVLLGFATLFLGWTTMGPAGMVVASGLGRVRRIGWGEIASVVRVNRDTLEFQLFGRGTIRQTFARAEVDRVLATWREARGDALDTADRTRFAAGEWVDFGPIAVSRNGLRIEPDVGVGNVWSQKRQEFAWSEVVSITRSTRALGAAYWETRVRVRGRWLAIGRALSLRHPWLLGALVQRAAPEVRCELPD